MKRLLIPTDFSETSEAAVHFGLQLAAKNGYDVILHHSVDFAYTYESMFVDAVNVKPFTSQVVDDCEIRLEQLLQKCNRSNVKVTKRLTVGNMLSDIKSVVKEEHVDLIVMGTKGASGLQELFIGSNTEKVVRLVPCPVISIPNKVNLVSIRKMMVPIDLRELRPGFLKQISLFQRVFSCSVEFVWVKTPHVIENTELITEEFNNLLGQYEIASSSFTIIHDVFPDDGILAYEKEEGFDIIAMATHARRGLAHLFSGSTTEDVMNHLNIPLWSFKIDETEKIIELIPFQDLKELPIN